MTDRLSILKGLHPGRFLDRELKRRGLKQNAFAETIGEYAQTISAIIKGRRDMNIPLALKIEQALQLEEGFLMTLQIHYDIKQEKKRQTEDIHPDFSKLRRILFWDTSMEKIDWMRQKRSVIRRVFERGNAREKVAIRQFYGKDVVDTVLAETGRIALKG